MIITINGLPGSGKTTLAKALAKKLNLKFYSVGEIRRSLANLFGLTIDEFNKIGEKYGFTDVLVDELIKYLIKSNAVIDGRIAWYLFPKSIKILLICNLDIAAERIFKAKRKTEKKYKNVKEVKKELKKRIRSDLKRYKKYYRIKDLFNFKNYDLIIDTSKLNKKTMIKVVLEILEK